MNDNVEFKKLFRDNLPQISFDEFAKTTHKKLKERWEREVNEGNGAFTQTNYFEIFFKYPSVEEMKSLYRQHRKN